MGARPGTGLLAAFPTSEPIRPRTHPQWCLPGGWDSEAPSLLEQGCVLSLVTCDDVAHVCPSPCSAPEDLLSALRGLRRQIESAQLAQIVFVSLHSVSKGQVPLNSVSPSL